MARYTVTITQTETRTYVLDADTEDAAVEQAQAWNEERSGDTPEGAVSYDYGFDSDTWVSAGPVSSVTERDRARFWEDVVPYFGLDTSFDYEATPEVLLDYLEAYDRAEAI